MAEHGDKSEAHAKPHKHKGGHGGHGGGHGESAVPVDHVTAGTH